MKTIVEVSDDKIKILNDATGTVKFYKRELFDFQPQVGDEVRFFKMDDGYVIKRIETAVPIAIDEPLKKSEQTQDTEIIIESENAESAQVQYVNQKTNKNGLLYAVLCSIAIGVVSFALMGLFYYWGYISFLFGFITPYFVVITFMHFTGKANTKLFVTVSIITIIMTAITLTLTLGIAAQQAYASYNMEIGLFDAIQKFFSEYSQEYINAFIIDVVLAEIFTIGGIVGAYFSVNKYKNNKNIRKN